MKITRLCLIVAFILSFLCGTSQASVEVGQPVPMDSRLSTGSTGWFQSNPVIASSGSIDLAVWVDMRDSGRTSDLFATRIAADGTVLDPLGIRLTTHASVSGKPDVCWNGENFFVVYVGNAGVVGTSAYGVRVSADGVVLDAQPIVISSTGYASDPKVSWDGTSNVVVFVDKVPGVGFYDPERFYLAYFVRRISRTGGFIDAEPMRMSGGNQAVASSPDGATLAVWCGPPLTGAPPDVFGMVLDHTGSPVIPVRICATDAEESAVDCCWAGDHFKVVWIEESSTGRSIKGTRVSSSCVVLDPSGWTVSAVAEKQSDPQIAYNGTNCLVTWTRKGSALGQLDIYGGRLNAAGSPLDGTGIPICSGDERQIKPAVASLGEGFLTCWMDSRSTAGPTIPSFGFQVRGLRVASDATPVGAEFPLTRSAPQHKMSCSAYSGRAFLVCWEEWSENGNSLYGELIDAYTGAPVTTTPFVISPLVVENSFPAAAWNGQDFVVTWLAGTKVLAKRVTPAGAVLDGAGIVIGDNGTNPLYTPPSIASDGNRSVIAYKLGTNVRASIMSRDGSIAYDTLVANSRTSIGGTGVCWTGQCYLLAWKQPLAYSGQALPGGIDYTTVSADGVPSTVSRITDTTFPDFFKLACNGQNALLAAYGPDIRTRRFSLAGVLTDTTPVTIPDSSGADSVNVAWNGADYVVSWQAGTSDPSRFCDWQDDMHLATVSTDNQIVGSGVLVADDPLISETGASMCAGPLGRIFMAYSSFEGQPYQSVRIKGLYADAELNLTTLGQIASLYEGAYIKMDAGPIVTASFLDDRFCVQSDRSFGIGIKSGLASGIFHGDQVSFTGKLAKLDGETVIEASEVLAHSSGNLEPRPIGMISRNLGGIGPSPAFYTVDGSGGLYNIGLLVTIWGRVTGSGDGFIYLDDGSSIVTDGHAGVKVYGVPSTATFMEVTGISGSELSGDKVIRVIRATGYRSLDSDPPVQPE